MEDSGVDGPLPAAAAGQAPAPAPPVAPRVPFHCSECGKSFRYRSDLRRHFARHTALKPHACPRCGKGFKHSFNLANHLRSHTGERPYRCSACPKGFRDSTGLLHHQVVHTGEKPYCCLICELRFSSRSSLGRHLKRQHRGMSPPTPAGLGPSGLVPGLLPTLGPPGSLSVAGPACSACSDEGPCVACGGGPEPPGPGPGSWVGGWGTGGSGPFVCGACGRCFLAGAELAAHWAAHTDVKPFKCPRCERDFNAPALLERHKLTHDLQGSWPGPEGREGGAPVGVPGEGCQELPVQVPVEESPDGPPDPDLEAPFPVAAELGEASEETLYQCDCGTFFASAAALATHLDAHSGPASCVCGVCGAVYGAVAALEEHHRGSHGAGPSPGGPPAGSGRTPAALAAAAAGKKVFSCSECEKLFRSPRDLERHVLVHTGEKPFPCLECGKFFRHECYLKRHRLLHGPERPFPCHVCGKGFITLSNLSRHLKLHRGMD
ncbi:flt3-interacting zinc finger protein 1 isoform X3 [Gracilinanus agilis]|uniref:flt3-interacting zinc finger protein 1 isoform X3 n=1 Tax=Gracilinanus agilis TaxID=191870 RepID=UPI001CFF3B7C|nr:flt3-interacting zinc finger protein 1 isoform X3 [Gracilinanus agilis]